MWGKEADESPLFSEQNRPKGTCPIQVVPHSFSVPYWCCFSPLPCCFHGAQFSPSGCVFREILTCPTVQLLLLKSSLFPPGRNGMFSLKSEQQSRRSLALLCQHQSCSSCRPSGFCPPTLYGEEGQNQNSLPMAGGWKQVILKVHSNPNLSVILCFKKNPPKPQDDYEYQL